MQAGRRSSSGDFKGLKNVVERMRSVNDWVRITTLGRRAGSSGRRRRRRRRRRRPRWKRRRRRRRQRLGRARAARFTELVTIKTTYPRLGTPSAQREADDGDLERAQMAVVAAAVVAASSACGLVEVEKLLRVLSSLSASDLKIQNAIVCVVPGQMVILKVYMQDDSAGSFIIYYMPCTRGGSVMRRVRAHSRRWRRGPVQRANCAQTAPRPGHGGSGPGGPRRQIVRPARPRAYCCRIRGLPLVAMFASPGHVLAQSSLHSASQSAAARTTAARALSRVVWNSFAILLRRCIELPQEMTRVAVPWQAAGRCEDITQRPEMLHATSSGKFKEHDQ